jgi:Septum formation initiator
MPLAVATAVVMLVMWFPLSTLWHQQSELDATNAQIAAIRQQQQALKSQAQSLSSTREIMLRARELYQLVLPKQSLIQVLPGQQSGVISPHAGDPGFQPLAPPSSLTAATSTPAAHAAPSGFWSRLMRTLEFWR